jgi:hypothetical protein
MKNERAVGNPPSIPSGHDVCRVLTHNLRSEAARYARWARFLILSAGDAAVVTFEAERLATALEHGERR